MLWVGEGIAMRRRSLTAINKQIQRVMQSTSMDVDRRRELLDKLRKQRMAVAKAAEMRLPA
jgi:hypothetical protein